MGAATSQVSCHEGTDIASFRGRQAAVARVERAEDKAIVPCSSQRLFNEVCNRCLSVGACNANHAKIVRRMQPAGR